MHGKLLAGAAALALIGSGCQVEEVAHETRSILGGTQADSGQFPTVVAIAVDSGRRGLCTGTLVAPSIILTAAHCIDPATVEYSSPDEVTENTVVFFDSADLSSPVSPPVAVAATTPHADFRDPGDPDVGVIRLAAPRTDRAPSPINFDPDSAPVGVSVTMVGYGISDSGSAGRAFFLESKSSVSCSSAGVSDQTFLCFNQTDGSGKCSGDSGGPSFATIGGVPTVVGITSFGDRDCEFFGADMRADASETFLAEAAPELSPCVEDNECGEDRICDVGRCIAEPFSPGGLGSECGDDQPACLSGLCAAGPGGERCTVECTVGSGQCPSGFECLETGGATGACWPEEGGGCSAGGGAGGLGALLVGLALIGIRRRRG
jgi:hypothetical protein